MMFSSSISRTDSLIRDKFARPRHYARPFFILLWGFKSESKYVRFRLDI